jgi:histidinol dehydrogenase
MKRSSILKLDPASLQALGPAAITLARAEGLEAHSRSVGVRIGVPPAEESSSKANE